MFEVRFFIGVTVAMEESNLQFAQEELHNIEDTAGESYLPSDAVEDIPHIMRNFSEDNDPGSSDSEEMWESASSSDSTVYSLHSNETSSQLNDNNGNNDFLKSTADLFGKRKH